VTIRVLNELEAIKRLLILQLVTSGVRVDDVAHALGMTRGALLKVIPLKWIARQGRIA
jgi:predicted transcriptional regulator